MASLRLDVPSEAVSVDQPWHRAAAVVDDTMDTREATKTEDHDTTSYSVYTAAHHCFLRIGPWRLESILIALLFAVHVPGLFHFLPAVSFVFYLFILFYFIFYF